MITTVKKLSGICMFLIFVLNTNAQDLILTKDGDSLNCKISKIRGDYIYFSYFQKNEIRNTLIDVNNIKLYQYNYYSNSEIKDNYSKIDKPVSTNKNSNYSNVQLNVDGGIAIRTAKLPNDIPPSLKDYYRDMKSGLVYNFDIMFYFSEQWGGGFKYNSYNSKSEYNNYSLFYEDLKITSDLRDITTISFMGPIVSNRYISRNNKNSFQTNVGIGYLDFKEESFFVIDNLITGNTVGLIYDIAYESKLNKNWALAFKFSWLIGSLTEVEVSNKFEKQTIKLKEGEYEGLSHIDFSIGLRCLLF